MFAGHFGVAAMVRGKAENVPVWALMAASQLPDLVFLPLVLAGVEGMEQVSDISYGGSVITAQYSHSLVSVLVMALLTAWLGARLWGRKGGILLGGLTFSHWLLDLLVHRPDIPILPGNLGDLPLLGLGLWTNPQAAFTVEALLTSAGGAVYLLWLRGRTKSGSKGQSSIKVDSSDRPKARLTLHPVLSGILMTLLLVISLVIDMP